VAIGLAIFAAPASGSGGFIGMLPILLLIPVMYFVLIMPQQKRQKKWQQMLSSIKPGDKVTTAGGVRGTILSLKDDFVIVKVAPDGIKMEVAKSAIASVTTQDTES
jgi:preprotein translocase subunit YajC